jgi:hypothetical protein
MGTPTDFAKCFARIGRGARPASGAVFRALAKYLWLSTLARAVRRSTLDARPSFVENFVLNFVEVFSRSTKFSTMISTKEGAGKCSN